MLLLVIVLLQLPCGLGQRSLRDHPIASPEPVQYLDGSDWTLSSIPSAWPPLCSTLAGPICNCGSLHDGSGEGLCWSCQSCNTCANCRNCQKCTDDSEVENGITVPATVPGDLVTDLQRAGVIGDPYFNNSYLNASIFWNSARTSWRYEKQFQSWSSEMIDTSTLLVLDGVKMAAHITLNGQNVGFTTSQFLRYRFDITDALVPGTNVLQVNFEGANGTLGPELPDDEGRFMGCTGGWDWAPLSPTRNSKGTPTFSKGLWKSVYLAHFPRGSVAINHLAPQVFYHGPYPTTRLSENGSAGDTYNWTVLVRVEVWSAMPVTNATLQVEGSWDDGVTRQLTNLAIPAAQSIMLNLTLPASRPKLWWPLGLGEQHLYSVTARIFTQLPSRSPLSSETSRSLGFRSVALVTVNDTDPEVVASAEKNNLQGTGNFSMFFRVNGVPLFSRGANLVPMEAFEGRVTAAATVRMVRSVAAAHFNMLRVWAGGVYQYRAFYEECDALGILIYHDMMFIEQGHGPCCPYYACASGWSCGSHPYNASCDCDTLAGEHQRAEITHQIRRLSPHPSIIVYDGCNECSGSGRYSDFVMTNVAAEDWSRAVWPASPSPGWVSGVHRLTSLPVVSANGDGVEHLVPSHGRYESVSKRNCTAPCTACQCSLCGCNEVESHGPYVGDLPQFYAGLGMTPNFSTAVFQKMGHFASDLATGPSHPGHFTSEFGCTGLSSFESMSPSLPASQWSVESASMRLRNHPPRNQIERYFGVGVGPNSLDTVGKSAFQRQLYQHTMAQAWWIKMMLEQSRRTNEWGMLFWMLNEIWPTSGWGSLEYGPASQTPSSAVEAPGFIPTRGQVAGGRWKPLHHILEATSFRDVICACDGDGRCFLRNDRAQQVSLSVSVTLMRFLDGQTTQLTTVPDMNTTTLASGPGAMQLFCVSSPDNSSACAPLSAVLATHGCNPNGSDCLVRLETTATEAPWADTSNEMLLSFPRQLELPEVHVEARVVITDADRPTVSLLVTHPGGGQGGMALAVVLTTASAGRFLSNVLTLSPGIATTVVFEPWEDGGHAFDIGVFERSLRIQHLQQAIYGQQVVTE